MGVKAYAQEADLNVYLCHRSMPRLLDLQNGGADFVHPRGLLRQSN